jgi:hypothetical protein
MCGCMYEFVLDCCVICMFDEITFPFLDNYTHVSDAYPS